MAFLRDCKSSSLPRVTGIGFFLFEWEVAWRKFEVHSLKKLANRIHASIFSSFFSKKKLLIVVVRDVCPSVGVSVCHTSNPHLQRTLRRAWPEVCWWSTYLAGSSSSWELRAGRTGPTVIALPRLQTALKIGAKTRPLRSNA